MSDAEIIKALDICANTDGKCEDCPYDRKCFDGEDTMIADVKDLVHRLLAEIERLRKENHHFAGIGAEEQR